MKKVFDTSGWGKIAWILLATMGAVFLKDSLVYGGNSIPGSDSLSISIMQPVLNKKWATQNKFTAKDDLVIQVSGKVCGKEGGSITEVFKPVRTGVEKDGDYSFFTAKRVNGEKGYVVTKHYCGWEDGGIREVTFVNYEWNYGCYEEKKLNFKSRRDYSWVVGGADLYGREGGLYISKDESLVLKIDLKKLKVLNEMKGIGQKNFKRHFSVYSMKTLKAVDEGFLKEPVLVRKVGEESRIVVREVEYKLFWDWIDPRNSGKINFAN